MIKNSITRTHNDTRSTSHRRITIIMAIFSCAFLLLGSTHSAQAQEEEWVYIVSPGDNLWNLTRTYLKDMGHMAELQRLNQIQHPRRIPPGSHLRVPISWLKVQPAVVTVQHLQGTIYLDRADGSRQLLTTDMTLHVGDTVHTEANSMATLQLADGSTMLLQENSQLTFDTLNVYGKTGMVDTRIRLLNGRIESNVRPVEQPAGRFEIWTPAALSAVRGTRFRTAMNKDDGLSRTEVSQGHIRVSASAEEIIVAEGFGTVVAVGEAPAPPRPLLAAPNLSEFATMVTVESPRFTLLPLTGAVAYRVQIAPGHTPNAPLFDHLLTDINFQSPRLGDGDYVLRVRGVDIAGLEGMDAEHRFTVDIRPAAPAPTMPEPGAFFHSHQINFQWQAAPDVTSYRLQLAADETFSNLMVDTPDIVTLNWKPEQPLAPGLYYWRIASTNNKGKASAFSVPQAFTVLQNISAPQIQTATEADYRVNVTWDSIETASTYELQIAYDPHFEELIQTINTQNSATQFPSPPVASYYLRARAVDAAGQFGPYGEAYHMPAKPSHLWIITAFFLIGLAL